MNGKSRTRYSPKWQAQPSSPYPLTTVCLTLPATLWLHRRLFKHIFRTKYHPFAYLRTAHDLSTVSVAGSLQRRSGGTDVSAGHVVHSDFALYIYIYIHINNIANLLANSMSPKVIIISATYRANSRARYS